MAQQYSYEINVLLSSCHKFRHGEIMHFQTQTTAVARVHVSHYLQSRLPTYGKHSGFFRHTMRIITKRLVKR